jgi:hypothetical protein
MADIAGLSTLGIKVYQALSADQKKVTDASAYSQLTRINSIGEASITPENIDASALEDLVSRFVAGRATVTDSLAITINQTDETMTEWTALLGKTICIMIDVPNLAQACFAIVTVPNQLPLSAIDQNGLLTMAINCTINNFIGWDAKVEIDEEP